MRISDWSSDVCSSDLLIALRPERVSVELGANGWPVAHRYRVGDTVMRFAVEDAEGRPGLLHLKSMHPLDDHYGLGCLGAAAQAIAVHNTARSEERRVGKAGVSKCRYRGSRVN